MQLSFLKIKLLSLILLFTFTTNARWATIEDASKSTELCNISYQISKDGSSNGTIEVRTKILKEAARNDFAQYRIIYPESQEKITILEAKIITSGKTYFVDLNNIEYQPLASQGAGFDSNRQILIAFPNVEIGSEVFLKYSIERNTPIKNHFDYFLNIATSDFTKHFNLTIDSKIPLYLKFNDPKNILEIKKVEKSNDYKISINLVKPLYDVVSNENGLSNYKQITWVSISSDNNWLELAKKMAPKYETVISEKLPELFIDIANQAKNITNEVDQINKVTSLLNEKIQYMGDWKLVEGAYFPRSLQTIADSQIGDCKDFTVSLGAILKTLGYKTQAALIYRSNTPYVKNIDSLPSLQFYNHAFLRVVTKDGKTYWIDPTNMISMAQEIFIDVSNRPTLVLDSQNPLYTKTPQVDYKKATYFVQKIITFNKESSSINVSGNLSLLGSQALNLTGAKLQTSDQIIKDYLFKRIANKELREGEKKEMIINSDLTSRIVSDLLIKYEYSDDNVLSKTNLGPAFEITGDYFTSTFSDSTNQILHLYIHSPFTFISEVTIKNKKAKNIKDLNVEIDNKWIYCKLTCAQEGDDIKIDQHYYNKVDTIFSEELATKEYKDFKETMLKLDNIMLILEQ